MKDIYNRIRQARRHAKLSQQTLATRVGVHRSAVAVEMMEGLAHARKIKLNRKTAYSR